MDTFTNPMKGMSLDLMFSFDFPLPWDSTTNEYKTPDCLRNVDLTQPAGSPSSEVPAHEAVYGLCGNPQRHQGFPCIYEVNPENEDPQLEPYHDQIIDVDRDSCFDHTGRLSGDLVDIFEGNPNYVSIVKMHIIPLTQGNGAPIEVYNEKVSLVAAPEGPNVWYWEDPSDQNELIYTAHLEVLANEWGQYLGNLGPGIYKLIISWEFWDEEDQNNFKRLPMNGFDESMSFQLSDPTQP